MPPFTPPGLLATDLDGSLAVNGIIMENDLRAAGQLKSAGIPILVITGRNYKSLSLVKGVWDIADGIIFSSGVGFWENQAAIPQERGRLSAADVNKIRCVLNHFGEDYCVLNPIPDNHRFRYMRHRLPEENPDFDTRMSLYREWARPMGSAQQDAAQVLIIRPGHLKIPSQLLENLTRWSVFHASSPLDCRSTWIEILPKGVNKGSALAWFCGEKSIHRQRVMALGNDYNDTSMLSWAGHGRVVSDAPAELKSRFKVLPPAGEGAFEVAVQEMLDILCS